MLRKIIFYYEKIFSKFEYHFFVRIYFEEVDEYENDDPMFK